MQRVQWEMFGRWKEALHGTNLVKAGMQPVASRCKEDAQFMELPRIHINYDFISEAISYIRQWFKTLRAAQNTSQALFFCSKC